MIIGFYLVFALVTQRMLFKNINTDWALIPNNIKKELVAICDKYKMVIYTIPPYV